MKETAGKPQHRWKDAFKKDPKKKDGRAWTGLM